MQVSLLSSYIDMFFHEGRSKNSYNLILLCPYGHIIISIRKGIQEMHAEICIQ
jgi:hypothetical protein